MSTLQAANIQSLSSATLPVIKDSAGTEYGRFCRAFVNFNGSTNVINGSFNVSSTTKNGTGDYTVNFTNAMVDANYSVVTTCSVIADQGSAYQFGPQIPAAGTTTSALTSKTSSLIRMQCRREANYDLADANVSIFR